METAMEISTITNNLDVVSNMIWVQVFLIIMIGLFVFMSQKSNRVIKIDTHDGEDEKYEQIQKMRKISLAQPLAEKMRPKSEEDIIGQEDGLLALKIALCAKNPQHIIIYGSPGVGKTAAARVALEMAKAQKNSSFYKDAPFIEIDATTLKSDDRNVADPLIGSVHDPIYQGAGVYGNAGIPQPKFGAVSKAHGGVLFIDEIGELKSVQMNKLLKVLEDRKVYFESGYYSKNSSHIPKHIHDIFQNGLPADFRLIGATTRSRDDIPPALRSRCVEISFKDLTKAHIRQIVDRAVTKELIVANDNIIDMISKYSKNGRDAMTITEMAINKLHLDNKVEITDKDIEWVVKSGGYTSIKQKVVDNKKHIGKVNGLAVSGYGNQGEVLDIQCVVKKASKQTSQFKVTGLIEEEELNSRSGKSRRKSMAQTSVDNIISLLRLMYNISLDDYYVHVNFPGGTPVDGPSAGVAMFCCIYSALFNEPISSEIAITGEITIHGEVFPVGGVTEKIIAAKEAGVKKVYIPSENMQQTYLDYDIEVIPISKVEDIVEAIWDAPIIKKATQILHA